MCAAFKKITFVIFGTMLLAETARNLPGRLLHLHVGQEHH